jgi:hypothetical protein
VDAAVMRVGCVCALLGLASCHALAQEVNDQSDQIMKTFGGYDCSGNCSAHKVGYEWAAGKIVTDETECGPGFSAFAEGCKAFAQDPSRGSDIDDQGNPIETNPQ